VIEAEVLGDWGGSTLRLWLRHGGATVDRIEATNVSALSSNAAEQLRAAVAPWRAAFDLRRIVLCGMAGARSGLHEAPYIDCPASQLAWTGRAAHTLLDEIPVSIAPGIACRDRDGHNDLMRGEETQVFGACLIEPGLGKDTAKFVLPGTHSKWVTVKDGAVTEFRTFVTGELYALLGRSSLLAAGSDEAVGASDAQGFAEGVARARAAGGLIGNLFHARAAQLRAGRSSEWARGYLSGLLLTSEILAMAALGALPDEVLLVGADRLCERYTSVFDLFSVGSRTLNVETCTLAGLEMILAYD
jgi:2-dehydro-3-deoxygalactonokinase